MIVMNFAPLTIPYAMWHPCGVFVPVPIIPRPHWFCNGGTSVQVVCDVTGMDQLYFLRSVSVADSIESPEGAHTTLLKQNLEKIPEM